MPYADKRKLRIGLQGLSLEAINKGKLGIASFPTGPLDPTIGQREWETFQVEAFEDIREKRDIIVTDNQGRVKEHTPVELSYEKSGGGYQRVTENNPFPVVVKETQLPTATKMIYANGSAAGATLQFKPVGYLVLHKLELMSETSGDIFLLEILDAADETTWQSINAFKMGDKTLQLNYSALKLKQTEVGTTAVVRKVAKGDGVKVTVRINTTGTGPFYCTGYYTEED